MTAVFAFQGWGQLGASIVALIVTAAYKHAIFNVLPGSNLSCSTPNPPSPDTGLPFEVPIDTMWRIVIGFGCVPACIALYFRLTIPETPRFTMDIERNIAHAARDIEMMYTSNAGLYSSDRNQAIQQIEAPRASRKDFFKHFARWGNAKVLFGCAWSWFVLDVRLYHPLQSHRGSS